MDPMSAERMSANVVRLLSAPRDLVRCGARACPAQPEAAGVDAHRELYEEYAEIVDVVADVALEWWEDTLQARIESADDPDEATRQCWLARPAGPASFPGLVAVVRDFWLACDALNADLDEPKRVSPEQLLLARLHDGGDHADAVRVLTCMPYWPLGLDPEGNWV